MKFIEIQYATNTRFYLMQKGSTQPNMGTIGKNKLVNGQSLGISYGPLPVISTCNPIYRMYNPIYSNFKLINGITCHNCISFCSKDFLPTKPYLWLAAGCQKLRNFGAVNSTFMAFHPPNSTMSGPVM